MSDEQNTPRQPTGSHRAPDTAHDATPQTESGTAPEATPETGPGAPAPREVRRDAVTEARPDTVQTPASVPATPPARPTTTPAAPAPAAPTSASQPPAAPNTPGRRAAERFTPPPGTPERAPGRAPEPFSLDSTMGQDVRALGSEIKKNADPRRIAANAVLALTGAKPFVDAAKVTGKAAKAADEPAYDRTGRPVARVAQAGRPSDQPGPGAPMSPGEDEAAADARRRRNYTAQHPGFASRPGVPKAPEGILGRAAQVAGAASDRFGANVGEKLGAKNGAKIGARIGGPAGAAIGAGAGAALRGMKTPQGRRNLLIAASVPIIAPLAMVLAFVLILTMITGPSVSDITENSSDEMSLAAAITDGMDEAALSIAAEAGGESGIPWEILASIVKTSGNVATSDEVDPLDDDQVTTAHEENTAVGPYSLLIGDLDDRVHFGDESGEPDDDVLSMSASPYEDRFDLFAHMNDYRASSDFTARLVAATLAERQPDLDDYDLGAGVILASAKDGEDGIRRALEADDSDTTPDDDTDSAAPAEGNTESRALRDAYVDALAALPIEGIEQNAEAIYDQALNWYLGESGGCFNSVGTTIAAGSWVNPLPNSPSPSSEQDFGERQTGQGFHDGVDLTGTTHGSDPGSPVVAAAAGVATVEASVGYGAQWVKITHASGIITEYGHLESTTLTTGQQVAAGENIGVEGDEGIWADGTHLHFSVRENGEFVDPVPFFAARGVNLFGPASTTGVPVGPIGPSAPGTTPTAPPSGSGTTDPNTIRIVQSNIPSKSANRMGALSKAYSTGPDFVSLNEMFWASIPAFTAPGYEGWRAPKGTEPLESMSTGIAWRTDRWTKTAQGRITLVKNGPLSNDSRYAQWVTLTSPTLGTVSFISGHQMINPAHIGPNPIRRELYRTGMEHLQSLITTLQVNGPVFLAGDMNSQFTANDPWGPRKMFGEVGLTASMETLGVVPTHVGGGTIDYIFGPTSGAVATRQWTSRVASDHLVLGADWSLDPSAINSTGGTGAPLPESWTGRSSDGEVVTLDNQQLQFAQTIAAKGAEMGVPDPGVVIALMTVFVETKFKNYSSTEYPETVGKEYPEGAVGSDHDSVGLFQQRPQSGWGQPLELLDPTYAASAFFGGPSGPNGGSPAGLLDQPSGWESRDKGAVAQSVQGSAYPDRYAKWEQAATELLGIVQSSATTSGGGCGAPGLTTGSSFTLGSFNTLGHSHTKPGGNKSRQGYDQYDKRLDSAVSYLQASDVSVVGLQEFEPIQNRYLLSKYGSTYDVFPKDTNLTDAVAWRTADWTFVSGDTFAIPYFRGNTKQMPYVRLRNIKTGQEAYFISVHNPADTRGNAAKWRAEALVREKAKVDELHADGTDVYLVGDFNDVDGPHCALTPAMTSAFGPGTTSPCRAPGSVHIDQIYGVGTPTLSGGVQHKETNNKQTSDHPLVTATVATPAASVGTVPSEYNLGASTPATVNAANILGPMFGITTIGGQSASGHVSASCHYTGEALDLMVPVDSTGKASAAGKATGDALANYARANAASLQISSVIWYNRIWSAARASEGWRVYSHPSGTVNYTLQHMDHVHVSIQPCQN